MKKLLLLAVSLILITTSSGCTVISNLKNKFIKKQSDTTLDQTQQEQEKKDSGPIPVNPSHS